MVQVCDQILSASPMDDMERAEKLEFLLDLLSPNSARSAFDERVCDHIRELGRPISDLKNTS